MSFYIVTDVASDLPKSYIEKQKDFYVISMPYTLNGKEEKYTPYDGTDALHNLYQSLGNGAQVTTAQVSLSAYTKVFKELLKAGHEVLYIGFSSGLSGSFQAATLARNTILEELPNAKLYLVDSLCASLGQGLLVDYAIKKRDSGMNIEEVASWTHQNRQNLIHWFTVDDLDFLFRGGRLSKSSAFLGSMLKIKPILHVNFEGRLIPREKVAGRKRSLRDIAEKFTSFASPKEGQTVFISHGDDEEAANYTKDLLLKAHPSIKEVLIAPIGIIIGSHSGPGTVAMFFMGEQR